ncbi:MAG: 50S ribosomal protein L23 [Candidatus Woesearchaeota archaeon]
MLKKPINTEKAVNLAEYQKTLIFEVDLKDDKESIKKEFESRYNVKVLRVNTQIRNGKKYAYIKLDPSVNVIELANQLGMHV